MEKSKVARLDVLAGGQVGQCWFVQGIVLEMERNGRTQVSKGGSVHWSGGWVGHG